jgi:hypothetical protein
MIGKDEAIRIAERLIGERLGERVPAIKAECQGPVWYVYFEAEPDLDPCACVEVNSTAGSAAFCETL